MTCSEYLSEEFAQYLNAVCASLRTQRTVMEYRRNINLLCNFCRKDFLDITPDDAGRFFNYMEARIVNGSLQKATYNSRKASYNRVANFIEEQFPESGFTNPFSLIESMKDVDGKIRPSRIPSWSEIDTFLGHVDSPMFYLIFSMAFRIALSAGDIISLTKHNIQQIDDVYCIRFSKHPDRVIVLPQDIEEMLLEYMSHLIYEDEEGHLFYNQHNNPLTLRNLDAAFRKTMDASGLSTRYTLKDLRSRAILDMLNASVMNGVDAAVVGTYAGIKELRLASYVSAYTLVDKCPADLVNIQVKTC